MKNKSVLFLGLSIWILASSAFAFEKTELAGQWSIKLDPGDIGSTENWQNQFQGNPAIIPGIVTEAGLGDALALQPALTKQVFEHLHQKRSYIGAAWFYKELEIESEQQFSHATLFLERVLWTTDAWINGVSVGQQNSLCVPHRFNISGLLKRGKNLIALRVDNRPHVDLGTYGHAYTQQTQTIWNGILGRVEIQSQELVSLKKIIVAPQLSAAGQIQLRVSIENQASRTARETLQIRVVNRVTGKPITELNKRLQLKSGDNDVVVKLDGRSSELWSEFSPHLYVIKCQVGSSKLELVTGFRTVSTHGRHLKINDRPSFMRGTLDCCIFPKTGYPPTQIDEWKRIFETLKSHGLNHVRFHSWCPPESAFLAADELGMYLQPELPNWTARMGQAPPVDEFLQNEGERILWEYAHHPSFVFFSLGNELTGNLGFLDTMISRLRPLAPHLLYTGTSYSFSKRGLLPGPEDDFFISQKTKSGWVRGQGFLNDKIPNTDRDYSDGLKAVDIPLITHEVGQYCVFPNLGELPKYDGNLVALNFEAIRNDLAHQGRLAEAEKLTHASGELAALLYKEDIERALRTKSLSGIQLLGLQDFSGQSTATVGLLDAFWDSKGIVSANKFREFCGAVVPLLRMKKRTWTNEERFSASLEIANFGDRELTDAKVEVEIVDQKGKSLFAKIFHTDVPWGNGNRIGQFEFPLGEIKVASKLSITCRVRDSGIQNSWDVWCYPADSSQMKRELREFILHRDVDEEFVSDIANGEKILLLADRKILRDPLDGRFVPVFWSPLHFPNQPGALGTLIRSDHAVFRNFPTETHTNWQWWELLSKSTSLNATSLGSDTNAIVSFVDKYNRNAIAACLSEFQIGKSRVFVCTLDIESDPENRIVAAQLKKSLFAYLNSNAFQPSFQCSVDKFRTLFQDRSEVVGMQTAEGNLADSLAAEPYYWSGTPKKIKNEISKSMDTALVWEESITNVGYVADVTVKKDMVYTAKFRLGQFGGQQYSAKPIRIHIKARKDQGRWVKASSLLIKDMALVPNNMPGEYQEYQLSFAANEQPTLIGYDEMLLQIEETEPKTQGYIGPLFFDATKEGEDQPNVLFILADDLGWKDLGCYGSDFHETPSCDRLAAEGIRFTDAYAAAPVCSPTRVSIMTGKYPARLSTTEYFGCPTPEQWKTDHQTRQLPAEITDRLELKEQTLAEIFRASGYKTFFAGKWHCGESPYWPQYQGFETNVGGWTRGGPYGGDKYFSPYGNPMIDDGPPGEHLPDRLASETIEFIESNADRPFLAMLSLYSVHTPLMTREDLKNKYEQKRADFESKTRWKAVDSVWDQGSVNVRMTQDHAIYAGMVEAMDQAVGKVLATLDRLLLTENTIVVFVSDNGGLSTSGGKWVPTTCEPLRTGKGWLYEGGIRVPMIIKWPKSIPAGRIVKNPVITNDLFATLQSIGKNKTAVTFQSDGIDLFKLIEDELEEERSLFWHYPHYGNQGGFPGAAIRAGDWKLIQNFDSGKAELYNLNEDIGEQVDKSEDRPELKAELLEDLKAWQQTVGAKLTQPNPNSKH